MTWLVPPSFSTQHRLEVKQTIAEGVAVSKNLLARSRNAVLVLITGIIVLGVWFSAVTLAGLGNGPVPKKVEAGLAAKLAKAGPGKTFDVIVKLAPVQAPGVRSASTAGTAAASALKLLKSRTNRSQRGVLAEASRAKADGSVKSLHKFWITNAMEMKADAIAIRSLAARPEVKAVFPNFRVSVMDPVPLTAAQRAGRAGYSPSTGSEWNINKINAPAVWSTMSTSGTGAKVAVLDTGIDATHPDLAGKVVAFVEVDSMGNVTTTTPHDTDSHGTHVSGTIAGGNAGGTDIGVAPGARLMGAIVLPGGGGTWAQVMGGMEWAADPDSSSTTNDQPDAVNMSFGGQGMIAQMFEPIDNLVAAGVFPAVAVGNGGEGDVGGPADVPTAFAVGATDNSDEVAWFSGGGKVTWYDPPYEGDYIKPDAAAPGVDVRSSIPGGGYAQYSGTSMATPHVAGAAALLRSFDPTLTVSQMSGILQSTAVELGADGKDKRYGSGRIDALAAVTLAGSFVTFEGTVTAAGETTSAVVRLIDDPTGTVVRTSSAGGNGRFESEAVPGGYRIQISKYGYITTSSPAAALAGGETLVFSPGLSVSPRYKLTGNITGTGGASLAATATILSPVELTADAPGGAYSFSVPDGEYRVRASAFGYKPKDATVTVSGGNVIHNFALDPAKPTLLVLDVGTGADWSISGPYAPYFTAALDAAGASYDVLYLDLTDPYIDFPDARFLSQYRSVVWAAGDGPATGALPTYTGDWINGEIQPPVLSSYLDGGGKLFLTGQDVAEYMSWFRLRPTAPRTAAQTDPGYSDPFDFMGSYLHARTISWKAKNLTIAGRPGTVFGGKTMVLLGGDGADNQFGPDVIGVDSPSVAELVFTKESTGAASLRTYSGIDNAGKVVFFSFGLEGINSGADRTYAMSRALGWLGAPTGALSISPSPAKVKGMNPVTLSGKLTPALSGEKIVIEQKLAFSMFTDWSAGEGESDMPLPPGGGAPLMPEPIVIWLPAAEATTTAGGNWTATVLPMANSTYRAVWDGNTGFERTKSAEIHVRVKPEIIAAPQKAFVPADSKTYIRGFISPPPMGDFMMTLMSRPMGQRRWRLARADTRISGGSFRIKIRPQRNTEYRLISEKSADMLRAASPTLLVRTRHNLTLKAETGLIPHDVPIIFSGRILPRHSSGNLQLQRFGNGVWTTVDILAFNNRRTFEIPYSSGDIGSFQFRVKLGRDSQHMPGASKPTRVRFY